MARYTIWDLDVWANEIDGYDLNNWSQVGEVNIDLTGDLDDDGISVIDALIESGHLVKNARDKVYVDFNFSCSCIGVFDLEDIPLYELREVQ